MSEIDGFDAERAPTLNEARKRIRGRNGPIALEVARRWSNPRKGCRVRGVVIVLKAVLVSNRLLTMPEWVAEFNRARVEAGQRRQQSPPPLDVPNRTRQAQIRRAEEYLNEKGVGRNTSNDP